MKPKFRLAAVLVLLCCSIALQAQEIKKYFTTEELPDLIQCLPAPPAEDSDAFRYDVQRYEWGKLQRADSLRADMACRDAGWTYESLVEELKVPFGVNISREATPCIWTVLERSLKTVEQIRVAPKAYFHRIRPFEYFNEPTLSGEDDWLRGEGSYPSGHTIRAWLVAMLLSEINPAEANAIYARAWQSGESRVIAGAHWQTDVDASRVAAAIGYARLQTSGDFRDDMARAQEEFCSLK